MKILANIVLIFYGFLTVTNETEVKNVIAKDEVVVDGRLITTLGTEEKNSIQYKESERNLVYTGKRLFLDSSEICLNKLPKLQTLYDVSKEELGKWSKLFIAIKIEESGVDGKNSRLARERNNLVGMRVPNSRETKSIGATASNYAVFKNWFEAVQDFKIFVKAKERGFVKKFQREPKDEHEFVDYMYGSYNIYSKWQDDVHNILHNFDLQ